MEKKNNLIKIETVEIKGKKISSFMTREVFQFLEKNKINMKIAKDLHKTNLEKIPNKNIKIIYSHIIKNPKEYPPTKKILKELKIKEYFIDGSLTLTKIKKPTFVRWIIIK